MVPRKLLRTTGACSRAGVQSSGQVTNQRVIYQGRVCGLHHLRTPAFQLRQKRIEHRDSRRRNCSKIYAILARDTNKCARVRLRPTLREHSRAYYVLIDRSNSYGCACVNAATCSTRRVTTFARNADAALATTGLWVRIKLRAHAQPTRTRQDIYPCAMRNTGCSRKEHPHTMARNG